MVWHLLSLVTKGPDPAFLPPQHERTEGLREAWKTSGDQGWGLQPPRNHLDSFRSRGRPLCRTTRHITHNESAPPTQAGTSVQFPLYRPVYLRFLGNRSTDQNTDRDNNGGAHLSSPERAALVSAAPKLSKAKHSTGLCCRKAGSLDTRCRGGSWAQGDNGRNQGSRG